MKGKKKEKTKKQDTLHVHPEESPSSPPAVTFDTPLHLRNYPFVCVCKNKKGCPTRYARVSLVRMRDAVRIFTHIKEEKLVPLFSRR